MENYEKKYKESIERMKSWVKGEHPECYSEAQKAAEFIFPELKESEDERIRKEIIDFLKLPHPQFIGKRDHEKWIAWLEKQGEKKDYYTKQELIDMGFSFTLNGDIVTPDEMMEDMKKYLAWEEKHDEQKQADTPKFKVGDWITNGDYTWEVVNVTKLDYVLRSQRGIVDDDISYVDKEFNLWSIQNAKDGDVLVTPSEIGSESNEQIFLFKAINNRDYVDNCIEYYGCVYNGVFHKNKTGYMGTTLDTFYPATKEQRDLLFQKMKEEGYEWNSKKKELKKIEPKKLDADKVIEWLKNNGWCTVGGPKVEIAQINKFKKDFGL